MGKTGFAPEECIVVEDSRNGVLAAKNAGLRCIATTNIYSENEDLSDAEIVVISLGEPDGKKGELKRANHTIDFNGVVRVVELMGYFSK